MNSTIKAAARVWIRDATVWGRARRHFFILITGEALVYLATFGVMLGRYVDIGISMPYLFYVGPGLVVGALASSATLDSLFRGWPDLHERKVYEALHTAPLEVRDIVIGQLCWQATRGLMITLVYVIMLLVLGVVNSYWALLMPFLAALTTIVFAAPALAWAAIAREFTTLLYYSSFINFPVFFFSGVFFPVDGLPRAAQVLIQVSPLYHSAELARDLATGEVAMRALANAAYLLILAVVFVPIAINAFRSKLVY